MMNTYKIILTELLLVIFAGLIYTSCSEDPGGSLYDSNYDIGQTPVINNVDYQGKGLAGITIYTITGQNFSPLIENNHVYFGPAKGTILDASATQLIVRAPNYIGDSLDLKVDVQGAQLFSEAKKVSLNQAVFEIYGFTDLEKPYAFDLDANGNIYFSYTAAGVGQGISKLSADSLLISQIGPKKAETFYTGLKYNNSTGFVYGAWGRNAIFSAKEGNTTTDVFFNVSSSHRLFDLDFDQDQNLWTAGAGSSIYSVAPDKSSNEFIFEPVVSSVRVFNGYLYVAATADTLQAVWRFAINAADNLGEAIVYFDFSNYYSSNITAITFSESGDLFIGTDGAKPIIRVTPAGAHEEWYAGVISGPVMNFAWDEGEFLYYSREASAALNQTILKIDMELSGAPYYGRN
jgi:IPT/TIG domain